MCQLVATASPHLRPVVMPETARKAVGPAGEGLTVVTDQIAEFGGVERILTTILARYPAASLVASRFDASAGFPLDDFEERLAELTNGLPAGDRRVDRVRLVGPEGRRRWHFLFPLYARALRSSPIEPARMVLSVGGMGWSHAVRAPAGARHIAYTGGPPRPLYARALRANPIEPARLVLSVGGMGWSHAVRAPAGARHVAYTGGPPRPFYGHSHEYIREYPRRLRPLIRAALPALRSHHRRVLSGPDAMVANSRYSAAGLERVTGRPVGVLYPPARTTYFTPEERLRSHYLVVSRLRPHKRIDVVIEAFRRIGAPLVIAGEGPWRGPLERVAPPNVRFVGHVGDEELRELYRGSRAVVSASVEEFGLCLAEALGCGTPVIAPRAGGSGEIVEDGVNGAALEGADVGSIVRAVERIESAAPSAAACRASAERFSEASFEAGLARLIG